MGKRSRCLEDLFAQTCEACYGYFDTTQGLMAHQSTSRQCAWYKKGKLREIFVDSEDSGSEDEEGVGRRAKRGATVKPKAGANRRRVHIKNYLPELRPRSPAPEASTSSGVVQDGGKPDGDGEGEGLDERDNDLTGPSFVQSDAAFEPEERSEHEDEDEDEAQDLIFVPTAGPSRAAPTGESSSAPARHTAIALDDDNDASSLSQQVNSQLGTEISLAHGSEPALSCSRRGVRHTDTPVMHSPPGEQHIYSVPIACICKPRPPAHFLLTAPAGPPASCVLHTIPHSPPAYRTGAQFGPPSSSHARPCPLSVVTLTLTFVNLDRPSSLSSLSSPSSGSPAQTVGRVQCVSHVVTIIGPASTNGGPPDSMHALAHDERLAGIGGRDWRQRADSGHEARSTKGATSATASTQGKDPATEARPTERTIHVRGQVDSGRGGARRTALYLKLNQNATQMKQSRNPDQDGGDARASEKTRGRAKRPGENVSVTMQASRSATVNTTAKGIARDDTTLAY
ncbi:uncharacterized protein B0H18DRAFT_963289 [Fomitopsis serialis]|uniref:uncharacterized protein n=1 Tax=Fomitopsis serialis TaxID=139415 RepID=UPI0020082F42|nr:uncharacterized protein B0H18DRAFT_963289 [Neoantrodia serialis]KAH9910451.1 hypothetical protein B0H18DRAFT_963289 [Neoantrodia serialis]